jgi:hypothetical protein
VGHTWKALRSTFQCFSQKFNSWAKSPQAIIEPKMSDSLPAADFLWGKADAQAFLVSTLDPAWSAQAGAGAGRGGSKWNKGSDLSVLSPQERRSIAAEIRKLDSQKAGTPGNTSGTPAAGEGKVKTKGSALWPGHIRVVSRVWSATATRPAKLAAMAPSVSATVTSPRTAAASPIDCLGASPAAGRTPLPPQHSHHQQAPPSTRCLHLPLLTPATPPRTTQLYPGHTDTPVTADDGSTVPAPLSEEDQYLHDYSVLWPLL